jgi:hypothetical protein
MGHSQPLSRYSTKCLLTGPGDDVLTTQVDKQQGWKNGSKRAEISKQNWSQNQVQNATLQSSSSSSSSFSSSSSSSQRRSIFQSHSSQPCFTSLNNNLARRSDCFLEEKRSLSTYLVKKSCLRPARYSGSYSGNCQGCSCSSSSSSIETTTNCCSVSFNDTPRVRIFEQPVQNYAANGWSKVFTE